MADAWIAEVTRTVRLAIPAAASYSDAREMALAVAWEWLPECAEGCDMGSASVRIVAGPDLAEKENPMPDEPRTLCDWGSDRESGWCGQPSDYTVSQAGPDGPAEAESCAAHLNQTVAELTDSDGIAPAVTPRPDQQGGQGHA